MAITDPGKDSGIEEGPAGDPHDQTFAVKSRLWFNKYFGWAQFDKHRTMERFGAITVVFSVVGALLMSLAIYSVVQSGKESFEVVSVYTKGFTSSRTQSTGEVQGLYRSRDDKRALVMMRLEEPSRMSMDPSDYEIYGVGLKGGPGSSPTKVSKPMTGTIYMFGQTGYMGVLLEGPEGFDKQLINLTVRANKELVTPLVDPYANPELEGVDPSFRDFDQWRVIVNLSGKDARRLPALDTERQPSAGDLYADAVIWPEEQELRRELDKTLSKMATELSRIDNYETELGTMTVAIDDDPSVRLLRPELPRWIDGDVMEGLSSDALRRELAQKPVTEIDGIREKTERARLLDTFEDGYMVNTYELQSDEILPGGIDFDWRSRGVSEGYFSRLLRSGERPSQLIQELGRTKRAGFDAGSLDWDLTNGMTLRELDPTDSSVKALFGVSNNLQQAYKDYFTLKRDYQVRLLVDLLKLEQELLAVEEQAKTSSGREAVSFRM